MKGYISGEIRNHSPVKFITAWKIKTARTMLNRKTLFTRKRSITEVRPRNGVQFRITGASE